MGILWKKIKSKKNLSLLEKNHDLRTEIGLWMFKNLGFQEEQKEEGRVLFR